MEQCRGGVGVEKEIFRSIDSVCDCFNVVQFMISISKKKNCMNIQMYMMSNCINHAVKNESVINIAKNKNPMRVL